MWPSWDSPKNPLASTNVCKLSNFLTWMLVRKKEKGKLRASSNGVPSSSLNSHEVNPSNLSRREHESWNLPLHTGSQVLSPKYDMHAYMATLSEGEAWDLNEEQHILIHWGPISFYLHLLGYQSKPIWNVLCPNLHSPHYLQACTKKLTKHGRCCMQNNQLPTKSHVEVEDSSD